MSGKSIMECDAVELADFLEDFMEEEHLDTAVRETILEVADRLHELAAKLTPNALEQLRDMGWRLASQREDRTFGIQRRKVEVLMVHDETNRFVAAEGASPDHAFSLAALRAANIVLGAPDGYKRVAELRKKNKSLSFSAAVRKLQNEKPKKAKRKRK